SDVQARRAFASAWMAATAARWAPARRDWLAAPPWEAQTGRPVTGGLRQAFPDPVLEWPTQARFPWKSTWTASHVGQVSPSLWRARFWGIEAHPFGRAWGGEPDARSGARWTPGPGSSAR